MLLKVLRGFGVLDLWRRAHRHDVVILVLHGTADPRRPSAWEPLRTQHSPEDIDRVLGVLSRHYRFVSLDTAIDILSGRRPPVEHAMVLTFDDGYRSNIDDALPVLEKYGVPMTVFLTVSHVDKPIPYWVDRLDFALQQVPMGGREVHVGAATVRFSDGTRHELRKSFDILRRRAKDECRDEDEFHEGVRAVCEAIEKESGRSLGETRPDDPWSTILTWDQVRDAAARGVRFGSHAQDHVRLGLLKPELAKEQLLRSREEITRQLGACRYLAYPDGFYTAETVELAKACGYEAAVTTKEGRNGVGCDLMSLKRITLGRSRGETELLCRVSGFSAQLSLENLWSHFRRKG